MKHALITALLSLVVTSCATKHAPRVVVIPRSVAGTTLPAEGIESIRYAENIKAYPLARYVDPNNRRLMHEGHTIYRVETTPKWNLHPNKPLAGESGPAVSVRDGANEAPMRDELLVELNRQKEATKAVVSGSQTVAQKLGELGEHVRETKQVAAENVLLKRQVDTAKQRLDTLEEELRRRQPVTGPQQPPTPPGKSDW